MKVASWILNVISLIALIVGVVFTVVWACVTKAVLCKIGEVDFAYIDFAIVCYIAFVALGFAAHMLAGKAIKNYDTGCKFVYYSSFPAYVLPFAVIFIVKQIIKLVKKLLNVSSGNSSSSQEVENVYIVFDEHGIERHLTLIEQYKKDYAIHGKVYHEIIGKDTYNRFIDDIGNYWRSYDDNETFVSEHDLQMNGYNFS